jgi:hypothetical protein
VGNDHSHGLALAASQAARLEVWVVAEFLHSFQNSGRVEFLTGAVLFRTRERVLMETRARLATSGFVPFSSIPDQFITNLNLAQTSQAG